MMSNFSEFILALMVIATPAFAEAPATSTIDMGSRHELMADNHLIDLLSGTATHRIHRPVRREIALMHDASWEGNGGNYHSVFYDPDYKDGGRYRMYYHAWQIALGDTKVHPLYVAYAESKNRISWEKPELGLVEHEGSKANNLVLGTISGSECHNLSVFKDANPQAVDGKAYKAVGFGRNSPGLYAFKSPDGIHWFLYNEWMTRHDGSSTRYPKHRILESKHREISYLSCDCDEVRRDIMMSTSVAFIQ